MKVTNYDDYQALISTFPQFFEEKFNLDVQEMDELIFSLPEGESSQDTITSLLAPLINEKVQNTNTSDPEAKLFKALWNMNTEQVKLLKSEQDISVDEVFKVLAFSLSAASNLQKYNLVHFLLCQEELSSEKQLLSFILFDSFDLKENTLEEFAPFFNMGLDLNFSNNDNNCVFTRLIYDQNISDEYLISHLQNIDDVNLEHKILTAYGESSNFELTVCPSLLVEAINAKHFGLTKALIQKGADVNFFYSHGTQDPGQIVFDRALIAGTDYMKALVDSGRLKVTAKMLTHLTNTYGYDENLLEEAIKYLDKGVDLSAKNNYENSIYNTILYNHKIPEKFLISLLDNVQNVNAIDLWHGESQPSYLMTAIQFGHFELVKALINKGADVNYSCDNSVKDTIWQRCVKGANDPKGGIKFFEAILASNKLNKTEEMNNRYFPLSSEPLLTVAEVYDILMQKKDFDNILCSNFTSLLTKKVDGGAENADNFLSEGKLFLGLSKFCKIKIHNVHHEEFYASTKGMLLSKAKEYFAQTWNKCLGVCKSFGDSFILPQDIVNLIGTELCEHRLPPQKLIQFNQLPSLNDYFEPEDMKESLCLNFDSDNI